MSVIVDKSNYTSLSFGKYLRDLRLKQNISLEEIAQKTKIRVSILNILEQEYQDKFPAQVFVKGFLRSYADALGADPDKIVSLYDENITIYNQPGKIDENISKRYALVLYVFLFLIMSFLFVFLSIRGCLKESEARINLNIENIDILESKKNASDNIDSQTETNNKEVKKTLQKKKLLLKVICVENTWIKIITDIGYPEIYSMKSGDKLFFSALSKFNILIGDANAMRLLLNERPINIPGKPGQVTTIMLP